MPAERPQCFRYRLERLSGHQHIERGCVVHRDAPRIGGPRDLLDAGIGGADGLVDSIGSVDKEWERLYQHDLGRGARRGDVRRQRPSQGIGGVGLAAVGRQRFR